MFGAASSGASPGGAHWLLRGSPGRRRRHDFEWAVQASILASLATVVHAVLHALRRRDGWYALAFRSLVWGPISATLPFSAALALVGARGWLQKRQGRSAGQWLWSFGRGFLRVWVILEVVHFLRYRIGLRTLSRQRHLPPRTGQPKGRRLATLQRHLRSLELAVREEPLRGHDAPVALGLLASPLRRLGGSTKTARSMTDFPRVPSLGPVPFESGGSGCDEDHAGGLSMLAKLRPAGLGLARALGSKGSFPSFPSAECLIRQWDCEEEQLESEVQDEEAKVLQLKRADISGWFCGAPVDALGRGNLKEWMAEYFFQGSSPEEVFLEDREEFEQMVDFMASWMALPNMPDALNPEVQCKRVSRDPISAVHRPFWFYSITAWAVPLITEVVCHRMGFQKFTAGVIQYWHRPARPPFAAPACAGGRAAPVVFCHGLGIGVLPYIQFVGEVGASGLELFLLDLPHISLRQESVVPSARETVACVVDMLAAWGHSEAHFIGHSFGSIVVSWMLQNSQVVTSASLLDPVCFLLVKHDILTNALYCEHEDPLQITLTYFVFRELYVAHTLARNFFWQQNDLAPERLRRPSLVLLSGRDAIVPAHSVRRLLRAEQVRRRGFQQGASGGGPAGGGGGPGGGRSCVELATACVESETEARTAATPMEVLWFPEIKHIEFLAIPSVRRDVVEAVLRLVRDAPALR